MTVSIAASILMAAAGASQAGGLSTSFGEVLVENLQIGQAYNTQELIGLPLRIRNTTPQSVEIEMHPRRPSLKEVKGGYEPIADLAWIRLEKTSQTVAAGQEAVSNVFLNIPRDKKLMGRRFDVRLESYTKPPLKGGTALSVGISSRLIFTISSVEGPPPGTKAAKVFTVQPPELFLSGVKVGEKINSGTAFGKSLRLINPNDFQCSYSVRSISIAKSQTKVRLGFEEAPDAGFLNVDEADFDVPPHGEKNVYLVVDFPPEARYRGKNYMFLLETRQRTGTPSIQVYNRVYVFTEE
ncbi:MAG TPA: hypothetical protein DEB40_00940 [Elusimicrobia bacterium]|nr:hypothetical protein [Elusimicrobiota bacterium]